MADPNDSGIEFDFGLTPPPGGGGSGGGGASTVRRNVEILQGPDGNWYRRTSGGSLPTQIERWQGPPYLLATEQAHQEPSNWLGVSAIPTIAQSRTSSGGSSSTSSGGSGGGGGGGSSAAFAPRGGVVSVTYDGSGARLTTYQNGDVVREEQAPSRTSATNAGPMPRLRAPAYETPEEGDYWGTDGDLYRQGAGGSWEVATGGGNNGFVPWSGPEPQRNGVQTVRDGRRVLMDPQTGAVIADLGADTTGQVTDQDRFRADQDARQNADAAAARAAAQAQADQAAAARQAASDQAAWNRQQADQAFRAGESAKGRQFEAEARRLEIQASAWQAKQNRAQQAAQFAANYGLDKARFRLQESDQRRQVANDFRAAVTDVSPVALQALALAGGGNISNALAGGGTALTDEALTGAARLLGESRQPLAELPDFVYNEPDNPFADYNFDPSLFAPAPVAAAAPPPAYGNTGAGNAGGGTTSPPPAAPPPAQGVQNIRPAPPSQGVQGVQPVGPPQAQGSFAQNRQPAQTFQQLSPTGQAFFSRPPNYTPPPQNRSQGTFVPGFGYMAQGGETSGAQYNRIMVGDAMGPDPWAGGAKPELIDVDVRGKPDRLFVHNAQRTRRMALGGNLERYAVGGSVNAGGGMLNQFTQPFQPVSVAGQTGPGAANLPGGANWMRMLGNWYTPPSSPGGDWTPNAGYQPGVGGGTATPGYNPNPVTPPTVSGTGSPFTGRTGVPGYIPPFPTPEGVRGLTPQRPVGDTQDDLGGTRGMTPAAPDASRDWFRPPASKPAVAGGFRGFGEKVRRYATGGTFDPISGQYKPSAEEDPLIDEVRKLREGAKFAYFSPYRADYGNITPTARAVSEMGRQVRFGVPVADTQNEWRRWALSGLGRGSLALGA